MAVIEGILVMMFLIIFILLINYYSEYNREKYNN